jgi:hypothetical protein
MKTYYPRKMCQNELHFSIGDLEEIGGCFKSVFIYSTFAFFARNKAFKTSSFCYNIGGGRIFIQLPFHEENITNGK